MTVEQLFNALFDAGLVIMIVTLVLSLGMGFTVTQVVAPMRRVSTLLGAIAVNAILAPAIAWGICALSPITTQQTVALVLVVMSAAGPAGLKACQFAKRADMALAVSLVIVLMLVNIVAAPLWAHAVVTGASVSAWTIIKDLLFLVLIPLVLGLMGRARYTEHADTWKVGLEKISNVALFIAIAAGIAVNWHTVVGLFGSWVIVVSAVIILIFVGLGALVGFNDRSTAITVGLLTSLRFTPIGLIVITTQLNGAAVYLAPALVFALVDTIIPFIAGIEIGRLGAPSSATPAAQPVS
jgi:BASS family bile acid:Na+ symporter